MKHIEKHTDAAGVVAYEKELKDNLLDKESLSDKAIHPAMKGPDVYEAVRSFHTFDGLKDRMFADQGGICCYCGCRLQYPDHPQYIVEHVYPKEKDRTLAGEYDNLLLSCRPTKGEKEQRKAAPKKERRKFFHCDEAKGSEVLSITPLQKDCQKFFVYDMFGGVAGIDEQAQSDIKTLNLDCEWLDKRREAAIEGEIYDEDGNLLPDEELCQRLDTIMRLDSEGLHTEFCFVIKSAIQDLLSAKRQ